MEKQGEKIDHKSSGMDAERKKFSKRRRQKNTRKERKRLGTIIMTVDRVPRYESVNNLDLQLNAHARRRLAVASNYAPNAPPTLLLRSFSCSSCLQRWSCSCIRQRHAASMRWFSQVVRLRITSRFILAMRSEAIWTREVK